MLSLLSRSNVQVSPTIRSSGIVKIDVVAVFIRSTTFVGCVTVASMLRSDVGCVTTNVVSSFTAINGWLVSALIESARASRILFSLMLLSLIPLISALVTVLLYVTEFPG